MKKIGIIINPHAKKVRRGKISIDDFKKISPDLVDLRVTQSLDDIKGVADDFKKIGIPYIGILGGDGSVHHVLTRLIEAYSPDRLPPVLILKGGTMDNIATSIQLKGKGINILKRFTENINSGKEIVIKKRNSMIIEGVYCFLFGAGLTANFLNSVYGGKEKGFISNVKTVIKAVKHSIKEPEQGSLFKGLNAEIYLDKKPLGFKKITAIIAGTVEYIGMGFAPMSRINDKEMTLHAIITGLKPGKIFRNIRKFKKGRAIEHPMHFDGLVSNFIIKSDEPFQYTMDGDMYDSGGKLEINMGPVIDFIYS